MVNICNHFPIIIYNIARGEQEYMKKVGIIRKVDELGRVVLPVEMRRTLGIEERDPLEIAMEGEMVVLRKVQSSCVFCGGRRDLLEFSSKWVCCDCRKELSLLEE
jgi:transcriptional pleiotropic regulator of transition state genes